MAFGLYAVGLGDGAVQQYVSVAVVAGECLGEGRRERAETLVSFT
ncbi:hypothetical protein [Streptomyces sp. NPDC058572]